MRFLIFLTLIAVAICCKDNGIKRRNGETWDERKGNVSFRKYCNIDSDGGWQVSSLGCVVKGNYIPVDHHMVIGGSKHICAGRSDGGVNYRSEPIRRVRGLRQQAETLVSSDETSEIN